MKTWTTKEGTVIPIDELKSSHLRNIISMLERNAGQFRDRYVLKNYVFDRHPQGEMAQIAFDDEMTSLMDAHPEDLLDRICPAYKHLIAEAVSRGLRGFEDHAERLSEHV